MKQALEAMDGDLQLGGYSERTRRTYLRCVERFARHAGHPLAELGEAQVRAFLLSLLAEHRVANATLGVYAAALKFLYATTLHRPQEVAHIPLPPPRRPLPDILSPGEVQRVLGAARDARELPVRPSAQDCDSFVGGSGPLDLTLARPPRNEGGSMQAVSSPRGWVVLLYCCFALPACTRVTLPALADEPWNPEYAIESRLGGEPAHRLAVAVGPFHSLRSGPADPLGGTARGELAVARQVARHLEAAALFTRQAPVDGVSVKPSLETMRRLRSEGFDAVLVSEALYDLQWNAKFRALDTGIPLGAALPALVAPVLAIPGLIVFGAAGALIDESRRSAGHPPDGWTALVQVRTRLVDTSTGEDICTVETSGSNPTWQRAPAVAQNEALRMTIERLVEQLRSVSLNGLTESSR